MIISIFLFKVIFTICEFISNGLKKYCAHILTPNKVLYGLVEINVILVAEHSTLQRSTMDQGNHTADALKGYLFIMYLLNTIKNKVHYVRKHFIVFSCISFYA